ncbi:MAG: uracil-DNA glycosylase, partial [Planctomycetes bacterium]|nr:uracil-DNA glycosylase [Planctomycetota bacterium]
MLQPLEILYALRNRFRLDASLGVDYVPSKGGDISRFDREIAKATEPTPAAIPSQTAPQPIRNIYPASRAASTEQPHLPSGTRRPSPVGASLVPYFEAPVSPVKEAALSPFREEAMQCQACDLCQKRNSVVWGEGCLDAKFMFIGEAPGRDEDLEGRPFVGRSGCLLTDIIEKGMKIPRQMTYIANVVKCRPPGNRDPKPDEISACCRFLKKQVEIIEPKVIIALGLVAGCFLLNLPPKSSGLRGRWHQYGGIPLRVIYHPSYLLHERGRNQAGAHTQADRDTWADVR